jgi:hypothetical protein
LHKLTVIQRSEDALGSGYGRADRLSVKSVVPDDPKQQLQCQLVNVRVMKIGSFIRPCKPRLSERRDNRGSLHSVGTRLMRVTIIPALAEL